VAGQKSATLKNWKIWEKTLGNHRKIWENPYKWRILAGEIIYKWWIFNCLVTAGVLLMSGEITHVKITQISGANLSENMAPGSIQ